MKNITRLIIALSVFFSGAALIPVVGLPTQGFRWQFYAGAYDLTILTSNHPGGRPGSFFTLRGENFTPNTSVTIIANGAVLGTVQASNQGKVSFIINSASGDPGYYRIVASGVESASTLIYLRPEEPLWPQEDDGTVFNLPSGIEAHIIFLPKITK